jgi:hypothetical protein
LHLTSLTSLARAEAVSLDEADARRPLRPVDYRETIAALPQRCTRASSFFARAWADTKLTAARRRRELRQARRIHERPGFADMLERIEGNGARAIIVADGEPLRARPTSFLDETPTAKLIRQILGAVSEFEKAMVVAKLRGARERKRRTGVKVEGRKRRRNAP